MSGLSAWMHGPCSLVDIDSEGRSVSTYQTTRRWILADSHPHGRCRENLTSHLSLTRFRGIQILNWIIVGHHVTILIESLTFGCSSLSSMGPWCSTYVTWGHLYGNTRPQLLVIVPTGVLNNELRVEWVCIPQSTPFKSCFVSANSWDTVLLNLFWDSCNHPKKILILYAPKINFRFQRKPPWTLKYLTHQFKSLHSVSLRYIIYLSSRHRSKFSHECFQTRFILFRYFSVRAKYK